MKSLQEQLMGSGLIDKKKAKAIQKEQRIQRKQMPKGQLPDNTEHERLEKLKQEKIKKDKELNRKKVEELERKAIQAQVKQLIKTNAVQRDIGDVVFQFSDAKKIKKIHVSQTQYDHLTKGLLAIASLQGEYILVARAVASKITERDQLAICYFYEKASDETEIDEDDPYKGFEIPDDLMW